MPEGPVAKVLGEFSEPMRFIVGPFRAYGEEKNVFEANPITAVAVTWCGELEVPFLRAWDALGVSAAAALSSDITDCREHLLLVGMGRCT